MVEETIQFLSGIPESIPDNQLENTVASILAIGVSIRSEEQRPATDLGKLTGRLNPNKKIIIHFINRKHCKKALVNQKKLSNINNNKSNFNAETKLYITENLTPMNGFVAFNCRKLKRSKIIHTCYTREGIVHIKQEESSKPFKIFHMSKFMSFFPILSLLIMRRGMLIPLFSQVID